MIIIFVAYSTRGFSFFHSSKLNFRTFYQKRFEKKKIEKSDKVFFWVASYFKIGVIVQKCFDFVYFLHIVIFIYIFFKSVRFGYVN